MTFLEVMIGILSVLNLSYDDGVDDRDVVFELNFEWREERWEVKMDSIVGGLEYVPVAQLVEHLLAAEKLWVWPQVTYTDE